MDELEIRTFRYFWETAGITIFFHFIIGLILMLIVIGGYFLILK